MENIQITKVIGPNRKIFEGVLYKTHFGGTVTIKISENEYVTGIPVKDNK